MQQDSNEQAAERFRLTIPLMKRHNIPLTPNNYTVWYQYATNNNPGLTDNINKMIASDKPFSDDECKALHMRYIAEAKEAEFVWMCTTLHTLLTTSSQQLENAREDASAYQNSLTSYSEDLGTTAENNGGDISSDKVLKIIYSLMSETKNAVSSSNRMQFKMDSLNEELTTLRDQYNDISEQIMLDPLTDLFNRNAFDAEMKNIINTTELNNDDACLIMIDIDYFKKINDTYGHIVGDEVIKYISNKLRNNVKGQDIVARYGGEEFAIILPNTKLLGAMSVAKSLRKLIAESALRRATTGDSLGKLTISAGVAQLRSGETPEQLITRADKALYEAKKTGRNRVCYSPLELDLDM